MTTSLYGMEQQEQKRGIILTIAVDMVQLLV